MSTLKFELDAEIREDLGKGASRRLRHANKVPAIIYGAKKDAQSLTLEHDKVHHALAQEAFYSHVLTLNLGNKKEKVILKALQRHPSKPRIQHIDFLRIDPTQKLHMHIPLHFIGEEIAPGVKNGGQIMHLLSDIEIACLPHDLPEFIEVDMSGLELNQSIHLSEIKLPKGVSIVAFAHGVEEHDQAVVSIHLPRVEEEPELLPGATEEAVSPSEGEEKTPTEKSE